MSRYDFQAIEEKWQERWEARGTFRTLAPGDAGFDGTKPKFYVLDMFPYPSGAGLHVGHPLGYIATDIVARYKRMTGHNVLHPMGFDAFGLPAEQFAVEHGIHPRITTQANIDNMLRQLKRFGLSYDWDRELATIDPDYVPLDAVDLPADLRELVRSRPQRRATDSRAGRAAGARRVDGRPGRESRRLRRTSVERRCRPSSERAVVDGQRLAYVAEITVNWCPALGTVLANEEVTADGRSERGNHPVFKRPLKQWMLRITAYAERLLTDLELVDWPEPIKLMQRNWIGRSEGAQVDFELAPEAGAHGADDWQRIRVFTTRPDTLFGATYMVLAPEHPLVEALTAPGQRASVAAYRAAAAAKSEVDRQAEVKTKTGVFTGALRDQPGQRRADPGLDRGLRPDGLRHRRDHGRPGPRPARLRVRDDVRACRSARC